MVCKGGERLLFQPEIVSTVLALFVKICSPNLSPSHTTNVHSDTCSRCGHLTPAAHVVVWFGRPHVLVKGKFLWSGANDSGLKWPVNVQSCLLSLQCILSNSHKSCYRINTNQHKITQDVQHQEWTRLVVRQLIKAVFWKYTGMGLITLTNRHKRINRILAMRKTTYYLHCMYNNIDVMQQNLQQQSITWWECHQTPLKFRHWQNWPRQTPRTQKPVNTPAVGRPCQWESCPLRWSTPCQLSCSVA